MAKRANLKADGRRESILWLVSLFVVRGRKFLIRIFHLSEIQNLGFKSTRFILVSSYAHLFDTKNFLVQLIFVCYLCSNIYSCSLAYITIKYTIKET